MEFGAPRPNEMPMTFGRLKWKSEVEFQYGGRSISETGSNYDSAVDSDIFTKFGTFTDFDLLRKCALPNWNRKLFASTAAILKILITS